MRKRNPAQLLSFYADLNNDPKNTATWMALADWALDHEDAATHFAARWCLKHQKYPMKVNLPDRTEYMWVHDRLKHSPPVSPEPGARLPLIVFRIMKDRPNTAVSSRRVVRYGSFQRAFEDLVKALVRLQELLAV